MTDEKPEIYIHCPGCRAGIPAGERIRQIVRGVLDKEYGMPPDGQYGVVYPIQRGGSRAVRRRPAGEVEGGVRVRKLLLLVGLLWVFWLGAMAFVWALVLHSMEGRLVDYGAENKAFATEIMVPTIHFSEEGGQWVLPPGLDARLDSLEARVRALEAVR